MLNANRTYIGGSETGFSLIELLVGLAISLFILTASTGVIVNNLGDARRAILESRVTQELRSAADLITRDLRRGSYWGRSLDGTTPIGTTYSTTANPYSSVSTTGTGTITYAYSRDATEDNTLTANSEQFGLRLNTETHSIQMLLGGTWQSITNPAVTLIPDDGLVITPTETSIDIRRSCAKTCTDTIAAPAIPTSTQNCPRVVVRTYNITIKGTSATDSAVTRTLKTSVRIRNEGVAGSCPA